jgi:hypothetical protein
VVSRNRLRLLFFGVDHGVYALEEPVQNLLQSRAGALLLCGFDETFPEFLQLFVSHCTSTNCNKDTAARSFLSCGAGGEKNHRTFSCCTDGLSIAGSHSHVRNIGDTWASCSTAERGCRPIERVLDGEYRAFVLREWCNTTHCSLKLAMDGWFPYL